MGTLFLNEKGEQHLTSNFKKLTFGSETVAKHKLCEIEAERRREDEEAAFAIEETKSFAEKHKWKYASTYAKTAPHEYLVKDWLSEEDRLQFERFVQTINEKDRS